MAFPPIDPATPEDTEVLLDLEHQLDVANDYRTLWPQATGARVPEAVSRPAPEPDPPPDVTAVDSDL